MLYTGIFAPLLVVGRYQALGHFHQIIIGWVRLNDPAAAFRAAQHPRVVLHEIGTDLLDATVAEKIQQRDAGRQAIPLFAVCIIRDRMQHEVVRHPKGARADQLLFVVKDQVVLDAAGDVFIERLEASRCAQKRGRIERVRAAIAVLRVPFLAVGC